VDQPLSVSALHLDRPPAHCSTRCGHLFSAIYFSAFVARLPVAQKKGHTRPPGLILWKYLPPSFLVLSGIFCLRCRGSRYRHFPLISIFSYVRFGNSSRVARGKARLLTNWVHAHDCRLQSAQQSCRKGKAGTMGWALCPRSALVALVLTLEYTAARLHGQYHPCLFFLQPTCSPVIFTLGSLALGPSPGDGPSGLIIMAIVRRRHHSLFLYRRS